MKKLLITATLLLLLSLKPLFAGVAKGVDVREVQTILTELCFNVGPIDGVWGKKTEKAVEEFFTKYFKKYGGYLGHQEFLMLKASNRAGVVGGKELNQCSSSSGKSSSSYNVRLKPLSGIQTLKFKDYSDDATVIQGIGIADLFAQGYNDIYLCSTTYRNYVDHPVVVLSLSEDVLIDKTNEIFDGDIPSSNQCTYPIFSDLNADGKLDLVYSEAGSDDPPWTGTSIEVAINQGSFLKRITNSFENQVWGVRSYATAVGNLDNDPFGEIILSSGTDASKSVTLHFKDNGLTIEKNPFVSRNLWWEANNATNLQVKDLDGDGKDDLFIGGNWNSPSNQIAWSGLRAKRFSKLPDTPFGHYSGNHKGSFTATGADITSSAIEDFDGDGNLDIINIYEEVRQTYKNSKIVRGNYKNSFIQILKNEGGRRFKEIYPTFSTDFGNRYYLSPLTYDLNSDGKLDIIFNYWDKNANWRHRPNYGSVILINLGNLNFERINPAQIQGGYIFKSNNSIDRRGMIFPIEPNSRGAKVAIIQPYSGSKYVDRTLDTYVAILELDYRSK